jgi:hypothetical protein
MRIGDFVRGDSRGNRRANMTEMPESGMNRALVDTQGVTIVLSPPNLIGPFPGGPGTFGKTVPHPAGGAGRCERRPAPGDVFERLFSRLGSGSSDDERSASHLLNDWVRESGHCLRNGARLFDEPPPSLARELSLFWLKGVVLSVKPFCPRLNSYRAQVERQSARPSFASIHALLPLEESSVEG